MSEHDKQALSAMLDNEAGELELRRLIDSVAADPELADSWRRYNLQQSVLHGHAVTSVSPKLARNVAAAIAQETRPVAQRLTRNAGRFALAASVALLVFAGLQTTQNSVTVPGNIAQQTESTAATTEALMLAGQTEIRAVDPEARKRLEEFINRVAITHEPPEQLEYLQDSPLYRLVNELQPVSPDR